MRHLERGGEYLRVADPEWANPLDGDFALERGGRWNPPGAFPVVYLCDSVATARANVLRRLAGQPYRPEDLDPEAAPVLVATRVASERYVDAISARGLSSLGLPETYPRGASGRVVSHRACQPIGEAAWHAGEPGIACRSAAPRAPAGSEELAWYQRSRRRLRRLRTHAFADWFW